MAPETPETPINYYNEKICDVCAETIVWRAIGPCDHPVCHECSLRMRNLMKSKGCCICKAPLNTVIFCQDSRQYSEYTPVLQDVKLGIKFTSEEIKIITINLMRFNCPFPACDAICGGGWGDLKAHVKKHKLLFCDVCTKHRKVFTHQQRLFTKEELVVHFRSGDGDDGFKGHPACGFCNDELFEHCNKQHEQCFLCKQNGKQHLYFANYNDLENHFRKDHIACMDPVCLEKKFQVFDSDIDFQAHQLEWHTDAKDRAKGRAIVLDFNYGSASRGGNSREDWESGRNKGKKKASDIRVFEPFPNQNGAASSSGMYPNRSNQAVVTSGDNVLSPNRGSFRTSTTNDNESSPSIGSFRAIQVTHTAPEVPEEPVRRFKPPPGFGKLTKPVTEVLAPKNKPHPPGFNPPPEFGIVAPTALEANSARLPTTSYPNLSDSRHSRGPVFSRPVIAQFEPADMPTPAELRAQTLAEMPLPAVASILKGDPDFVKAIEKLFDSSIDILNQFKELIGKFKTNRIDSKELLDEFIRLSLSAKPDSKPQNIFVMAGKAWARLADTLPEEASTLDLNTAMSLKKKKKKGVSLAEFESIKKGVHKKDAMLRAWNDFKVTQQQQNNVAPYQASSYSSAADVRSLPSRAQPRVMVLGDKGILAKKQTVNSSLFDNGQKFVTIRPAGDTFRASTPTSARVSNHTIPGSSASFIAALPSQRNSSSTAQTALQSSQHIFSSSPQSTKIDPPIRIKPNDFPGLPTSDRPARVTVAMLRGSQRVVHSPERWGTKDEDAFEAPGPKSKKKGAKVLMKWG